MTISVASTRISALFVDVDAMQFHDHHPERDLVSIELDGNLNMQGTLDKMLAVVGRMHELLLEGQAEREAAETCDPARVVHGADGSLRLENVGGRDLGWLDTTDANPGPLHPGDELLIEAAGTGWRFVRVADADDVATEPLDGYLVVPVVEAGQ